MAITKYDLDINKQAIIKPVVILRQGDHDIDTMQVSLSVANEPMDLTGATVKFMGNTANGRQIIDDAHVKIIDAKGGVFEYVFPSEAASDIGEYKVAYFSIILANGQSSTMDFRVQVLSGVDLSAPAASDYVSHYDTMVSTLNSAYDSATSATNTKMAAAVSSVASSAATVLDSALAHVADVNSQANNASSTANNAVSMASSVASAVTSQASYINSVASSAAADVNRALDKINNISVGGRNLLLGTRDWTDNTRWNQRDTVTKDTYMGMVIASTNAPWTSPTYSMQYAGILQVGKTYTFSTYVRNTSDTDTKVAPYYEGGILTPMGNEQPLPAHTDWVRVSITFKCVKDPTTSTANLRWEGQHELTNGFIQFAGYKLEAGNIATDWSPAPEDKPIGLSVGGRNLLLDTGRSFTGIGTNQENATFNAQNGMYYLAGGKKVSDLYNQYGPSGYLTISFDWVASGSTISGQFNPQWSDTPWGGIANTIYPSSNNASGHYTKTVSLSTSGYSTGVANSISFRQDNLQGNITISNVKLEVGNITTDWTPAPEDADNTFLKKTRELPAEARDFNYLALHMQTYQGTWWNGDEVVKNAPDENWAWSSIEVICGNGEHTGVIRTSRFASWFPAGHTYVATVDNGKISHWTLLADDANVVHNTGNETIAGDKTLTGSVKVSGTLDANQKVYTRTIGSTDNLRIMYTRVGNVVTGRFEAVTTGTFPLDNNDGYKSTASYPVNVIAYNIDAWFTPDNKFVVNRASQGNFMFITTDPLPNN